MNAYLAEVKMAGNIWEKQEISTTTILATGPPFPTVTKETTINRECIDSPEGHSNIKINSQVRITKILKEKQDNERETLNNRRNKNT